ncbi:MULTISPECIES: aspartyl/asparaginyl beta-hydroxylase domain-containing protein [unclassified Variovorax]|uniref:aspartyl/asparaginyl beta-hydroxylase domain-containing protein n=1 Tax=unclassified Variovorax TaxID=663243 RepID=UPI003F483EE3
MKNFHRLAVGINTGPLLAKIARNRDWWHDDTYLRTFHQGPFGETDSIILRFPPRAVPKTEEERQELIRTVDQHECIDLLVFDKLPEARDLVMNLFSYVRGTRLGRVMINRIQPGGRIYKHADTLEHANYWERHHICLQSAPGVVFSAGDEQVCMAPGEAWWFDNGKGGPDDDRPAHEVINNSPVERIHMVIDIRI